MEEKLRACAGERYMKVGADALFVETPTTIDDMRRICDELPVPAALQHD